MSERDFKRLGTAVYDRRAELGESQEEFVRRADMSVKTLQRIESGKEVRAATLGEVNRAAMWEPGSAQTVLVGGSATPTGTPDDDPEPEEDNSEVSELRREIDDLRRQATSALDRAEDLNRRLDQLGQPGERRRA